MRQMNKRLTTSETAKAAGVHLRTLQRWIADGKVKMQLGDLDRLIRLEQQLLGGPLSQPGSVKGAPHTTPVSRLDEARAARQPDLRYRA